MIAAPNTSKWCRCGAGPFRDDGSCDPVVCDECEKKRTPVRPTCSRCTSPLTYTEENYNRDLCFVCKPKRHIPIEVPDMTTKKKRPTGKPRKHPAMKSRKEVQKDRLEKEVCGELLDGTPWDDAKIDQLFDKYFDLPITTVCKELKRTESSVKSIIWKIIVGYNGLVYQPGERLDRNHLEWTQTEIDLLRQLVEKDQSLQLMQKVFNRTQASIERKIKQLKGEDRPTLFDLSGPHPQPRRGIVNRDFNETTVPQETRQAGRGDIDSHEGKKYLRRIKSPKKGGGECLVDVYAVLDAFDVKSHPIGHAIKKLLCAGTRGKGDYLADLYGAIAAINRAIDKAEEESDG